MPKKKVELEIGIDETVAVDTEIDIDDLFGLSDDDILSSMTDEDVEEESTTDDIFETMVVEEDLSTSAPAESSLSDFIVDIEDSVEHLTWVIYGKNGTGKTTILSTVDNMLVLAAEDGTLSIRDKAKGNAKKIRIDTFRKLEELFWLLKGGRWADNGVYIPTAKGEYLVKSLGFDTLTKLAEVCMRGVVLKEKEKDTSKDVITRTLKDWGVMSERMKYWLMMFKELPLQKVWLCQESANAEDIENDEYSIFPALNKSLRVFVQSEADIIGRTYIKQISPGKVQFRLSVAPNPTFITKDRTNVLGGVIPNPKLKT